MLSSSAKVVPLAVDLKIQMSLREKGRGRKTRN